MKKKGLLLLTLMLTGISVFGQKAVDMDKGMKYWEKAQIAYEKKDYSETFKNNKKSAELGCPRGMLSLGVCYACAYGTQKDREMSLFWYKKANEHPEDTWSYPRSFFNMARYYLEVKKDLAKSAQLLAEGMNFLTEGFEYWYKSFKDRYSKYVKTYKDFAYVSDYFLQNLECQIYHKNDGYDTNVPPQIVPGGYGTLFYTCYQSLEKLNHT